MNPTAMEDDINEFLGLPSDIGAPGFVSSTGGGPTLRPESEETRPQSYGTHGNAGNDKEADSGYQDLFGEETSTPALSFGKPDLQKMESLGHEPLFPDVDEAKIQPTVGLASNFGSTQTRVSAPQKEEFTIVLDPSSTDPRFAAPGNVPVADWVVPSAPNRREPMLVRQSAPSHHSSTPIPRQGGLHPSSTPAHGSLHGRNVTGPSTGARAVRIPPGCNPDLEPEFPTRAAPDQALKLPGQTRVTPDEYKEFLGLGHGEIFNLDLDRVVDPPWRAPGVDTTDFFNYGLDETTWKEYCKAIECHRQEFSMKKKIQTYESSNVGYDQDPDLPPEVAAAIAAESYHSRAGAGPDVTKALPIPVFQGADDYSLKNRRGRDFRRPEVRYDPEVILELAGGVEPSTGVNADYGEDYIGPFGPGDLKTQDPKPSERSGPEGTGYTAPIPKTEDGNAPSKTMGENDATNVAVKKEAAMFKDDDDFEDPRSKSDIVRPGELAMGMETDPQQTSTPWPAQKIPQPGAGGPPRPDFGRMYDPYAPPHDMWRPFYHGRGWRPRGPPDYWAAGRGYGRSHPDGGRGGRYWHGYGGPRRPGRRPPPPRYYDDYRPAHYTQWPRREDRPPPLIPDHHHHHHPEEAKPPGQPDHLMHEAFSTGEQAPYRDRDRRRHSLEREEERPRSHPRLRSRDYDSELRSFSHHHDRSRDYGRNHRRDDYDERRDRDRRRRDRSAERDMRRRGYSKERSRGRDRDDRRSRRYATSDSESESRYRTRSKDRD